MTKYIPCDNLTELARQQHMCRKFLRKKICCKIVSRRYYVGIQEGN